MNESTLLSISEAAAICGVSEVTLRQWTDEGSIKAFVTPGGHRRYAIADLKKFLVSDQKGPGLKELAAEIESTAKTYQEMGMALVLSEKLHGEINTAGLRSMGELGQNLLENIISYITDPVRREDTLQQSRDIGRRFGEALSDLGFTLTDSVEMFIHHREPLVKASTQLIKKWKSRSGRIITAIPLVNQVMDEALVALVSAYQKHQDKLKMSETNNPQKGKFNPN